MSHRSLKLRRQKLFLTLTPLLITSAIIYICIIRPLSIFYFQNEFHHKNSDNFDVSGREAEDHLLLDYLRDKVLIKPNSLPYNLTDPFMLDTTSVELANLSLKIFKGKKNGVFFEAGAFHPESHSMTIYLERFFGWTGLLVEPNPIQFQTLLYSNRKSFFMRACLSPQNVSQKLFLSSGGMQSRLIVARPNTFQVDCFPIYSILLASNFTSIDYFVLDVEGFEMEVLKTMPFEKIDVQIYAIEHYNSKNPEEIKKFMEKKGYIMLEKTVYDFIFSKNHSGLVKKPFP